MHLIQIVRRYFSLLSRHPMNQEKLVELRHLAGKIFGLMTVYELFMVAETYPVCWFINTLSAGGPYHNRLLRLNLLILALALIGKFLHKELTIRRVMYYWRNWRLTWGYGHWHQIHLCTAWHTAHSTGEKESVVSKSVNKIEKMIDDLLFEGIPMLARVVVITAFITWLEPYYGLVVVAGLVVFLVIVIRTERLDYPNRIAARTEIKAIEAEGTELVQNWWTIKQLGMEPEFAERHAWNLSAMCGNEDRRFRYFMGLAHLQDITSVGMRFALFVAIAWLFDPTQGIGTIFIVSGLAERIFSNLHRSLDLQRHLKEGLMAMAEFSDVLETVPTVTSPAAPRWPRQWRGEVRFDDVSFSYPEIAQPALEHVSFVMPAGSFTAIVGESGSGKTTLARLLLRDYDPTKGRIVIDGVDLRQVDLRRFLRQVGLVSQSFQLFGDTIANNIGLGRDYQRADIERAARRAHAHDFILRLPGDYQAWIGENGVRLSGGERQRIAIARALVSDPRIIIFDEATSALDTATQGIIQRTLHELVRAGEATIIVIAHRLSTIRAAEQVLVMHAGQIVESGSYAALVGNPTSHLARLCRQESQSDLLPC